METREARRRWRSVGSTPRERSGCCCCCWWCATAAPRRAATWNPSIERPGAAREQRAPLAWSICFSRRRASASSRFARGGRMPRCVRARKPSAAAQDAAPSATGAAGSFGWRDDAPSWGRFFTRRLFASMPCATAREHGARGQPPRSPRAACSPPPLLWLSPARAAAPTATAGGGDADDARQPSWLSSLARRSSRRDGAASAGAYFLRLFRSAQWQSEARRPDFASPCAARDTPVLRAERRRSPPKALLGRLDGAACSRATVVAARRGAGA